MHSNTRKSSERGFSLVELLIVMIVMSIIMGAVFTLMKSSLSLSNATFELTDTRENLRIAQEYINRDIINAGYALNDYDRIQVPQAFVTNYLARNASVVPDATKPGYVNLGLLTSDVDPGTIPVVGAAPAVNVLDGTDRISILKLDPTFTPIQMAAGSITGFGATMTMPSASGARLAVGEIYFFTSGSGTAFGKITGINTASGVSTVSFSAGAGSYFLNQPGATGPIHLVGAGNGAGNNTQTVNIRRAYISHYYVNDRNELMKREFGVAGAGFTDLLIAQHITGLSFRYILGINNANGTVQQPVNQLTSWSQQEAVRQIEINISGETTHQVIHRPKLVTETLAQYLQSTRGQDTMTTIASARNLQFRQATQPQP